MMIISLDDKNYISVLYEYSKNDDISIEDVNKEIEEYYTKKLEKLNHLENVELKKLNKSFERNKKAIHKYYEKERKDLDSHYNTMHHLKTTFFKLKS